MADERIQAWLVIQATASDYEDVEGRCYDYKRRIPNGQRIKVGNALVVARPRAEADGDARIIGIGRIGHVEDLGLEGRKAWYDRYRAFDPPIGFEQIGGDPRKNPFNSINPFKEDAAKRLLAYLEIRSLEELPPVESTMEPGPTPSAVELRDTLHAAVIADLVGPADGEDEEIMEGSVGARYLLGKLAPKDSAASAEESGELGGGDSTGDADQGGGDDGETEAPVSGSKTLLPPSFGMTFCVAPDVGTITVDALWGHYTKGPSHYKVDENGDPERVWLRTQAGGSVNVPLVSGPVEVGPLDGDRPNVVLRGRVRDPNADGERLVTLFLVNDQPKTDKNNDENWLFQAGFTVSDPKGAPIFRRRPSAGFDLADDEERANLAMLYRDHVEFAVGHGVSVHADPSDTDPLKATRISTTAVPHHDVPVTEAPDASDVPGLSDLELDMKVLAELPREALATKLRVLTREYGTWIAAQETRITNGDLSGHEPAAVSALNRCRETAERLESGIRTLEHDDVALAAFQFANRAMWHQRVRSIYVLQRRRKEEADLESLDVPENRSWRPFQLAFFLLAVPSLADPQHFERTDPSKSVADLLWFPTGGGKTEAYLGVAAFTMAIRRMHDEVGDYDGSRGVAVIMRYTLRLLTLQQFQRAATLICAMEWLRRQRIDEGDTSLGRTPFRIGLWVGRQATPNTTSDAKQFIDAARVGGQTRGAGSPRQLTNCPWCGNQIREGHDLVSREGMSDLDRTLTFCSDRHQCDFSRRRAKGEGLPVVVVDEEIYRLLPELLIATVDKFAQMPWKGEVQSLFGRIKGECQRHGFLSPESKCSGRHPRTRDLPASQLVTGKRLRPPDLIIQDEFHLISGPLGTMVGLYETAVDSLSSWRVGELTVRPKVVASTATVRKAEEQVHNVFARRLAVFPPNGLDVEDNFFSLQRPLAMKPGRRYLGVCAPGMARPPVLIQVYVAFLTAAQKLRERFGKAADPWMTLLGYFNSLRELGGMRRLAEDDVRTRAFRVTLSDIQRPGLAQRDVRIIQELTSRAASSEIPNILDQLEVTFPPIGQSPEGVPIDVVLATNMVSVGVDVQRLGLMVVNGQPKTTAEYIQATSRVGRRFPGLVCTVLNWARPRDLSHFETFEHYHATFYQYVEAQSVTPFAPRAVDRGLTGTLASFVRLDQERFNPNEGAGELKSSAEPIALRAAELIGQRAAHVTERSEAMRQIEGFVRARVDNWVDEATESGRRLGYQPRGDDCVGLLRMPGSGEWEWRTTPNSMREVEPEVGLILDAAWHGRDPKWEPAPTRDDDEGAG